MNKVEKLLHEGLQEHPEDWEMRMDLASKLCKRGEVEEAAGILHEAPVPMDNEEHLAKAYELFVGDAPDAVLEQAGKFLENHGESPTAQMVMARVYEAQNDAVKAGEHYQIAVAAAPDYADAEFEAWLASESVPLPEVASVSPPAPVPAASPPSPKPPPPPIDRPEDGQSAADEDVTPVVPVPLSRDATSAVLAAAVPPPALHKHLAPPPQTIAREALNQTGVVTAHPFAEIDILSLGVKPDDTKAKASAVMVAVLVHAVVFFILTLIAIAVPSQNPPEIVAMAAASDEVNPTVEKKEVQRQSKPNPSSASRMNVVTAASTADVAVPVVLDPIDTIEPIGLGSDFGMAMSFGAEGTGNVSFFGSKAVANKVVFVVDSSASMNQKGQTGLSKHELMKKELSKTVKELGGGVQYQIIFFSGPCWYVGDDAPNSRDKSDDWHEWEQNGRTLNFWHYKDGKEESLPKGKYLTATPGKIRSTIKDIEETPATYGTDWRVPLKMAINMEPDVIYFMTDGAVGKHPAKDPVTEDVLKFNRSKSNAKINSICLMVPNAMDAMGEISEKSRGELTLVLEDGTPIRGRELEQYLKDKGKGKKN